MPIFAGHILESYNTYEKHLVFCIMVLHSSDFIRFRQGNASVRRYIHGTG